MLFNAVTMEIALADHNFAPFSDGGMIQLPWRFIEFQKDSALAKWFRARTENTRGSHKKMIVALARRLLVALWRFVHDGVVPEGVILRSAH
ncbi:MAG: hypothetical protein C5B58_02605 [Acidobacteria bacterium]|nr:MAG: hypothetical protein C5B58_02605 [Acidobacteriota bacterium]